MVAKREEDGRGMDWELGARRHKLLHIEWTSNKVLPYSTGNYVRYTVINHNGKDHKKEGKNVYMFVNIYTHTYMCVCVYIHTYMGFLVAQMVKIPPVMQETQVWSLGQEDPLEKVMATHSSVLAWRIPCTEETEGLQSLGLQTARPAWATNIFPFLYHFAVL